MAAALWQSTQLARNDPPVTPRGSSEVVAIRHEFDLAASGMGALEANDVLEMMVLPAGCVVVDMIVDTDDLEASGGATVFAVGVMAGALTDRTLANRQPGTEFGTGVTTAQAGGVWRPTLASAYRVAPDMDNDRAIGIEFTAVGTGNTSGKIGLTVLYRGTRHRT